MSDVSGNRVVRAGSAEAVATAKKVGERAAVGIRHDLKGKGLVVYGVAREEGGLDTARVRKVVADSVGRYAAPEKVYVVRDLPKTRSGKIVRRLLRKIAAGELENLGDLSTLSDPDCVQALISQVAEQQG